MSFKEELDYLMFDKPAAWDLKTCRDKKKKEKKKGVCMEQEGPMLWVVFGTDASIHFQRSS